IETGGGRCKRPGSDTARRSYRGRAFRDPSRWLAHRVDEPKQESVHMNSMNNMGREKGATTIFMAVVLVGIIGIAAFAIDLGYGLVVKTELQNVADTATLAGTRELALVYRDQSGWATGDSYKDHYLTDAEMSRISTKLNTYSQLNKAGGVAITI